MRDFCYVEDVVDAMMTAAITPQAFGEVVNIGSGKPVSIKEVIEKVMDLTKKGKPIWGAYPYRKGENMNLYPDVYNIDYCDYCVTSIPKNKGRLNLTRFIKLETFTFFAEIF